MSSPQSKRTAGGLLLWTAFCLIHFPSSALAQSGSVVSYPLLPHHQERARRSLEGRSMPRRVLRTEKNLRRRAVEQEVGPLFQGYGTHYVDLWVGSPPQRQTVIVDTGSGTTAFPCRDCKKCGAGEYHIDQVFDESLSSTYRPTTCTKNKDCVSYHSTCKTGGKCHITQAYSEGSRWDAIEAIDSCYIAGPHEQPLIKDYDVADPVNPKRASHYAFNLTFGCQYEVTGLFEQQLADGILGMNNGETPYWQQMTDAGQLGDSMFSLCFSRQPTAERAGTEAGALTLGGYDTNFHETDMVYTSGATEGRERQWAVSIRRIFLRDGSAGESVKPKANGRKSTSVEVRLDHEIQGIVDSGTTDTFLPSIIAESFKEAYKQLTGDEYEVDKPMKLTEDDLAKMPTVILQFVSSSDENGTKDYKTPGLAGKNDEANPYDVLLAIPPSHYMEYDEEDGTYAARLHLDKSGLSFTLGANAMMGHDVLFDAENDRIGWAESSCNYTQLVQDKGYKFAITGVIQEPADEDEDEEANIDVDGDFNSTEVDLDAGSDGDVDIDPGTDFDADLIANTDSDAEFDSELDANADSNAEFDSDLDANADSNSEFDSDLDANTDSNSELDSHLDANTDSNSELDSDLDANADSNAEFDSDSDANADSNAEFDSDSDANADSHAGSDPDTDVDVDTDSDIDIESNSTDATEVEDGNGASETEVGDNRNGNSANATNVGGNSTNATMGHANTTHATTNGSNSTNTTNFSPNSTISTGTGVNSSFATNGNSSSNYTNVGLGTNTTDLDENTNGGPGVDEEPSENATPTETPGINEGTSSQQNSGVEEPGKVNTDPDADLEKEYNVLGQDPKPNATEPGKLNIDPDSDLEAEYEILKEEEDVNSKEKDSFVEVDCHEETIDRKSNITIERVKNETKVAYCKVKNGANRFKNICDSRECQIPVLVGLAIAVIAGMCLCSFLRCFFYYLFCCCCCKKKKDKGPRYQGLGTDDELEVPSYSDDPDSPKGKTKYRDNVRSKTKKGTSLSQNNGGEFI